MNTPDILGSTFTAILTMKSDWHVGSGTGRPGDVDSLVRRDQDGLPYVPGKTLTGIWRDACEAVALALDSGHEWDGIWDPDAAQQPRWQHWVAYLFGDQPGPDEPEPDDEKKKEEWRKKQERKAFLREPRRARISIRSAQLDPQLRRALLSSPQVREAITFVKPGISIDPHTGTAKPKYLRFEELVRVGAVLKSECSWQLSAGLSEEQRRIASALLIAGVHWIERLGGKRRRGAGRCSLIIEGVNVGEWLDWLEQRVESQKLLPAVPEYEAEDAPIGQTLPMGEKTESWEIVPLRLITQTPVIVPARTVGNLVQTQDCIPGTYLLPFVTAQLSKLGFDARQAIAQGDLLVTNATPEVAGVTGRPVPFNLHHDKLNGGFDKGLVYNRLSQCIPDEIQPKGYRNGYVGPFAPTDKLLPIYQKTRLGVETHNVVEDEKQRPTSNVGGVFSYQSINAGVRLRAEVRLRSSLAKMLAQCDGWREQFQSDSYCIGRARKDDYGAVKIELTNQDSPQSASEEVLSPEEPVTESTGKELRVWLLSQVLLRDERLRPTATPEALENALIKELGVQLKLKQTTASDCPAGEFLKLDLAARQQRTDSWHTRWGLPRPSLVGLAAGSCFVFEITPGTIDSAQLRRLSHSGIGERRAEGFGQLCFDDPLLTNPKLHSKDGREKQPPARPSIVRLKKSEVAEEVREEVWNYACLIEAEAWRKEIRRQSLDKASDRQWREHNLGIFLETKNRQAQSKPRLSQLGALRSVTSQLRQYSYLCNLPRNDDQGVVARWLAHLEGTPNRRDEWPEQTRETIRKLVTCPKRIWELLEINPAGFSIIADGEEEMRRRLWAEAVRTLVDACVRAHKRELEDLQKNAQKGA